MNLFKKLFTSKYFKTFLWGALDAFLAYLIVFLGNLDLQWLIPIIPALTWLTKIVNKKFLQKSELLKTYL